MIRTVGTTSEKTDPLMMTEKISPKNSPSLFICVIMSVVVSDRDRSIPKPCIT